MKIFKLFTIILFIIFSSLTSITYAETLKLGSSTYEGEVKKGKAHGVGIITFADGSKYEGQVKKNRIHGKGKYTDSNNNVVEGKFRRGKFKNKIDKKTREIIKLSVDEGKSNYFEIKGKGPASGKWFEAEKTSSGAYVLTAKGKKDMKAASVSEGDGGSSGSSGSGGGC
jgi:hypothetical protein